MVDIRIDTNIIKNVSLVIFDKDGTLIDLYNYWSHMVAYRVESAQKKLGFNNNQKKELMYIMGVDSDKGKLRNEGPVGLKRREIVMQTMVDALANIGFPDTYGLCLEAFKVADELSTKHLSKIIKPMNGMQQLIDILHEKGCKIAIATTDKTERAKLVMRFLNLDDKVDVIIGEDMVENCKPLPDMINLILQKLVTDRRNAVMVGDALTDVEMGINAGLAGSIGVCSGLTSKEELLKKTRYVIEDISEIRVS